MRQSIRWSVLLFCVVASFSRAKAAELPEAARKAIQAAFPDATMLAVEKEKEFGAVYYEVEIRDDGKRKEVEVSPDGIIGEIEYVLDAKDLPTDTREAIERHLKGGTIRRIEHHERRGTARSGEWVALETPVVFYDVKYRKGNKRRSRLFDSAGKPTRDPDDPDEQAEDDAD